MANRAALIRQENQGLTVTRRGRRFIEFDLGGGKRRWVSTIEPLHLRGSETEIDATWVADTGAWQWKIAATDYQFHARSVFNVGNLVEFRIGDQWVTFDPQSINWINQDNSRQQIAIKAAITGRASDATLSFPAAYGAGRHFEYIAHPKRLIKHITIDSAASLPTPTVTGTIQFEAEFTLTNSAGVDLWLDGVRWPRANNVRVRTSNRIEFRNIATGEVLWHADAPVATDANGETIAAQYEVRRQGGSYFCTVRVPREWLLSAAYPVVVDPTLTLSEGGAGANTDTHIKNAYANYNFGANAGLDVGGFIEAGQICRTQLLFDVSSIEPGSTIDSAALSLYCYEDNSANANTVHRALTQWYEGDSDGGAPSGDGSTWNYRNHSGSVAWAGGAGGAAGSDWATDATASDATASSGWYEWAVAADVQDWVDEAATNYGWWVRNPTDEGTEWTAHRFCASDHATTANRPKLVVEYTESGGTGTGAIATRPTAIGAVGTQLLAITGTDAFATVRTALTATGEQFLAITGEGAFAAQPTALGGTGTMGLTGAASLSAQPAALAATGTNILDLTGTAALAAQAVAVAATGANRPPAITGTGALVTQPVAVDGEGVNTPLAITGTGALGVQLVAMAATGASILALTGTGSLAIQLTQIAGTGSTGAPPITGEGAIALQPAQIAASGMYTPPAVTGTGAIAIQPAAIAGTGVNTPPAITGTASLFAQAAQIAAAGINTPPAITGAAELTTLAILLAASGSVYALRRGRASVSDAALYGAGVSDALRYGASVSDTARGRATPGDE